MSTLLDQSYKLILESKDSEIDRLVGERDRLEKKVKDYEMKESIMRIFLVIQAGLLMIAFQLWD